MMPTQLYTPHQRLVLFPLLCFICSFSTALHAAIWTESFNNLSQWEGSQQSIENGVLTISSTNGHTLHTTHNPLNARPASIKFKAKPAQNTPGYASLQIHLFTSETGQLNDESYSIVLSGGQRAGYKIVRAGNDTVFYSGQDSGLFTNDHEWHEIELQVNQSNITVYQNGFQKDSIDLTPLSISPKGSNITIKAESGQWDFDWLETTLHSNSDSTENNADDAASEPVTSENAVDLRRMDWVEPFNHLNHWRGGNHQPTNGVLKLSNTNGGAITSKIAVYDEVSASETKPVRFYARVKPSAGTPNYATLRIKLFTDSEGNNTAHSYELTIKGNESSGYKIVRAGYDTVFWSGYQDGLLSNDQTWHDLEVEIINSNLKLWRDGVLINQLALTNFPESPTGQYITLEAESGSWDFDTLATAGNHHREEFDELSRWTPSESHISGSVGDHSALTLTSENGDSLTSQSPLAASFDSKFRFRAKPSQGTPNYATLMLHFFTGPNGEKNQHTYSLVIKGNSASFFKVNRAGYQTLHYSGNGYGLLQNEDTWETITAEFKDSQLLVYRGSELMINLPLENLPSEPEGKYITLQAESGHWDFDWMTVHSETIGSGNEEPEPPVNPPQSINFNHVSAHSVQLSWQAVEGISEYIVFREGAEIARTANVHFTDANLSPEQTYQYQIASTTQDGRTSDRSPVYEVTTSSENTDSPLLPPKSVTGLNITSTSLELSWTEPDSADQISGYIVYRDQQEVARTSSLFYQDFGLSPEQEYSFQLASFNNSGAISALTEPLSITTLPEDTSNAVIQPVADHSSPTGTEYRYQPTYLKDNSNITWSKEYGPDEATVDPQTGLFTWQIPESMPSESIHLGVKARSGDGETTIETWILTVGNVPQILYVGPQETHKTVADGLDALIPGGTMIIRDGTYRGEASDFINNFSGGSLPPAGDEQHFTTVMAENPGRVIFDGEGKIGSLIRMTGTWNNPDWPDQYLGSAPLEYISFRGIHVNNALNTGIFVSNAQFMKFIDMGSSDSGRDAECGFTGNTCGSTNIYVRRSNNLLFEDVYTYGHARYQISFRKSIDSIVRRAVSRVDGYIGREPVGGMMTYCSKNIQWQNAMVLDSNSEKFWVRHTYMSNSFGYAASDCKGYPENSTYHSGISINNSLPFTGMNDDAAHAKFNYVKNSIGWGDKVARDNHGHSGSLNYINMTGPLETDQLTLGQFDTETRSYFYHDYHPLRISNSIIYRAGWDGEKTNPRGLLAMSPSEITFNFVNFFENGMTGWSIPNGNYAGNVYFQNKLEVDPRTNGLTYLPQIDSGSLLATAGESGKRMGAHIINKLGRSGTFYGQPGWDTLTEQALWPYPHEDLIKEKFANYSYTGPTRTDQEDQVGPDETLSGARGFAASGNGLYGGPITLTSYIWEQLGSACPEQYCPK
ncbi:fibronectin type III domain-containing protein [Litoribacillus peritrichatus]|uniref:Fibronectin type-III domain-containing protein n=1 Tax=Litoribacillus peritrichatus TaxID=718191 RepID=A0ABP7MC73_9GAMM